MGSHQPQDKKQAHATSGFSLIESLIALGISGTAALLFFTFAGSKERTNRAVDLRYELTEIRNNIKEHIDCAATLAPYLPRPVTKCSGKIAIKAKGSGTDFIPAAGGKLGNWRVSSQCVFTKGSWGLTFQASRVDNTGTTLKDADTGKALDESHALSKLFPDEGRPCAEYFGAKDPVTKCAPGRYVIQVKGDGSVVCETADKVCVALGGSWTGGKCMGKVIPGQCPDDTVVTGIDGNGKPVCVKQNSLLTWYNVKNQTVGKKGGPAQVQVCCNAGDTMYACTGSREKNVDDTCPEEKCGYIGAVIKGNCCTAGADTDAGTEAIADGMCLRAY